MFSPETLAQIKPKGLNLEIKEPKQQDQNSERRFYKGRISGLLHTGEFKRFVFEFSLPTHDDGVFHINDSGRFIIPSAKVDVQATKLGYPYEYYIKSRTDIIFAGICRALDAAFTDFYMSGNPPTSLQVQNEIDGWFKTCPEGQQAPDTKLELRSLWEAVHLEIPNRGLDQSARHFNPDWIGLFDPTSTPSGNKVNLTYRLPKGAKIVNKGIVKGDSIFCSTIEDNHLPVCLSPRRTHVSRGPYESHLRLDVEEEPLIGKSTDLSGRHLLTAVMRYGAYTGEDAIVISESAADKLAVVRTIFESFHAMGGINIKVREGDLVKPGMLLAEITDPVTGNREKINAKKIRTPGTVKSIRQISSTYFGIPALRTKIEVVCRLSACNGDKIFTRGAIKGVVRVIPDEKMPILALGDRVEMIVSPDSVIGRRAMSVYWEGMANLYAMDGGTIVTDHFSPKPTFPELVDLGYGKTSKAFIEGQEMAEEIWAAPMFVIRLDKIASEIMAFHQGDQPLNGMGLAIDSASSSGQKRDFAKGVAMLAKGMNSILREFMNRDTRGGHALTEIEKVIQAT